MGIVARVVEFAVGSMAFVEGDETEVVLLVNRRVDPSVVDDARRRVLDVVTAARGGVPPTRVQARLFAPAGLTAVAEEGPLGGFASFPVVSNQRLAGLLAVGGRNVARLGRETEQFMAQIANQAHIVAENSRLFERVRNLSIRDSLTDLYNHRHIVDLLQAEVERVGRYQEAFSVLMIDVDHFKQVNDRYGHPMGDQVLREVAALLKDTLRAVDALGRYGGEEFMAVLPHTNAEEARATAERLRARVEGHAFGGKEPLRVTISVGVATYPGEHADSAAAVVGAADRALYRAKDEGRNRVA
jgi:diguanylate cyclase (GGDEF)-like protein